MGRWFGLAVLALVWGASCKSSEPPASNGDDDAGDDDGGACSPCIISGVGISCGAADCVDGVEYQCSPGGEGAIQIGICGDDGDDGGDASYVTLDSGVDTGPCTPSCLNACNIDDGCGNTCQCTGDEVCNTLSNVCTNGCQNTAGQACVPGSSVLADCCIDDTQCATNDSGISSCCAATGIPGLCQSNADCCDYPQVTCDTSTDQCQ